MKRYITPSIIQVAAKAEIFQTSYIETTDTNGKNTEEVLSKKNAWESFDNDDEEDK